MVVNELRERVFYLERQIWKPTGGYVRPVLSSLVISSVLLGRYVNLIAVPKVFLRDLGPLGARRSCPCLVVNVIRERVFR